MYSTILLRGWTLIFALYGIVHPTHREVTHTEFYKKHYGGSKNEHKWMILLWSVGLAAWAVSAGLFAYRCETKNNYDVVLGLQLATVFVIQLWSYFIPQHDQPKEKEVWWAYALMIGEIVVAFAISVVVLILMSIQSDWVPIIPWVVVMVVLIIAGFLLFYNRKTSKIIK